MGPRSTPARPARLAAVLIAALGMGGIAAASDAPAVNQAQTSAVSTEGQPLGPPRAAAAGARGATTPTAGTVIGPRELLRTGGSLALVVVLIVAAAAVAKRLAKSRAGLAGAFGPGGPSPAGVLEVLGRYPIARGQSLVLLQLDRRVLLLSSTGGGRLRAAPSLTTLCEVTDPEDVASILVKARDAEGSSIAARFKSLLHRFDAEPGAEPGREPAASGRALSVASGYDDPTDAGGPPDGAQPRLAAATVVVPSAQPRPSLGATPDDPQSLRRRLAALRGAAVGGAA